MHLLKKEGGKINSPLHKQDGLKILVQQAAFDLLSLNETKTDGNVNHKHIGMLG